MRHLFKRARSYTAESNIHVRAVRIEVVGGYVLPSRHKHVREAARLLKDTINVKDFRIIAPNGMRLTLKAAGRCTC